MIRVDRRVMRLLQLLALTLLIGTASFILIQRFIHARQGEAEWQLFDSQDYYRDIQTFPNCFRMEHPANWELAVLENGGTKNLGELRVSITRPNYLFWPNTGLNVWWRSVDETWTLERVKDWYVQDVSFGVSAQELARKQDSFQPIRIGQNSFTGLTQTFEEFRGHSPREQVILILNDDEAFAFSFITTDYDSDVERIFRRMIDSIDMCQ